MRLECTCTQRPQSLKMSFPYEKLLLTKSNAKNQKQNTSMNSAPVRQWNEWIDRCMEIDLRLNYDFAQWMACVWCQPATFFSTHTLISMDGWTMEKFASLLLIANCTQDQSHHHNAKRMNEMKMVRLEIGLHV